jgi:site-specific recombinase
MQKNNIDLSFYSFFTKYSVMEDYGFSSGFVSRIFKKILPSIPEEGTVEFLLFKSRNNINSIISSIDFENIYSSKISEELDISIKALCSKIAAFGLDNNINNKFKLLKLDSDSFETLLSQMIQLESNDLHKIKELTSTLDAIENNILALRRFKSMIGISLHLTIVTRRILEFIHRVKELLVLKLNLNSVSHWEEILKNYIKYYKEKYSIKTFIVGHFDLLIFEAVEHTSNKGGKYIADTRQEYWQFLYKSMLGGALIAFFALFKIYMGTYKLEPLGYAFITSLNYAFCFILAKQMGGIIATKQPAMTASAIAKHIDKNDDLKFDSIKEIVNLIKKVLGSQFISLVGNFTMALLCSCLLFKVFQWIGVQNSLGIEPVYLMKDVMPSIHLIGYAAIAGIFLALSGLISGYVDNKVIASKIAYRITNSRLFLKSTVIANFIKARGGSLFGNLSLGIFLGSAFLLSYIAPLSIDIRHIAFSTSYLGYSVMSLPFDIVIIIKALIGIMLIGFTNLIVSFSITLLLALKSRGAKFSLIPHLFIHSIKDFINNPLEYFIINNNSKLSKKNNGN